jgi:hypothetical protein
MLAYLATWFVWLSAARAAAVTWLLAFAATLAHDPAVADDPPAASDLPETRDQPMNNSAIRSTRCLAGSHPIQTQNVFITILRHCKPGTRGAHFE